MKLGFGCDPNAQSLKAALAGRAIELGHDVVDYGSGDPIYANTAIRVAEDVAAGVVDRGVVVCGTGIGMSLAANKVAGALCALVTDTYQARRAVLSNNANLIAMGEQVTGVEVAKLMLEEYLSHTFDADSRSGPKVQRIHDYEDRSHAQH